MLRSTTNTSRIGKAPTTIFPGALRVRNTIFWQHTGLMEKRVVDIKLLKSMLGEKSGLGKMGGGFFTRLARDSFTAFFLFLASCLMSLHGSSGS